MLKLVAPMLSGLRIVPSNDCQYPPAVGADDRLLVDFDQRTIDHDGLYLIERLGPRGVEWRGCRRFEVSPLRGLQIDQRGRGVFEPVADLSSMNIRVAGYVRTVYREMPPGSLTTIKTELTS